MANLTVTTTASVVIDGETINIQNTYSRTVNAALKHTFYLDGDEGFYTILSFQTLPGGDLIEANTLIIVNTTAFALDIDIQASTGGIDHYYVVPVGGSFVINGPNVYDGVLDPYTITGVRARLAAGQTGNIKIFAAS